MLNQRQLTLGLRWNLFDRFDRELNSRSSPPTSTWPTPPRPTPQREVAAQLTAALAQLDAARTRSRSPRPAWSPPTEDLRVQQERYRLGASTIVDVLSSQEALNQAEVDVVVARFTYLRAKAQIEALIGRTL